METTEVLDDLLIAASATECFSECLILSHIVEAIEAKTCCLNDSKILALLKSCLMPSSRVKQVWLWKDRVGNLCNHFKKRFGEPGYAAFFRIAKALKLRSADKDSCVNAVQCHINALLGKTTQPHSISPVSNMDTAQLVELAASLAVHPPRRHRVLSELHSADEYLRRMHRKRQRDADSPASEFDDEASWAHWQHASPGASGTPGSSDGAKSSASGITAAAAASSCPLPKQCGSPACKPTIANHQNTYEFSFNAKTLPTLRVASVLQAALKAEPTCRMVRQIKTLTGMLHWHLDTQLLSAASISCTGNTAAQVSSCGGVLQSSISDTPCIPGLGKINGATYERAMAETADSALQVQVVLEFLQHLKQCLGVTNLQRGCADEDVVVFYIDHRLGKNVPCTCGQGAPTPWSTITASKAVILIPQALEAMGLPFPQMDKTVQRRVQRACARS